MWISIQTKQVAISARLREKIETYVRSVLDRERREIGSVVVSLQPAKFGGEVGYACRLTIWSHFLGLLVANETGDTIRTAVQQALLRARENFRRRLQKRRSRIRRADRGRLRQRLAGAMLDELLGMPAEP